LPYYISLPEDALARLELSSQQIVDAIEEAIRAERKGEISTAPKSAIFASGGRYMMTTLSSADEPPITVVKSVMVSPNNPSRGLNAIEGAIILHDSDTGQLLAVMGSKWITAVRTAGLSAVVAKRLANPKCKTIAFIGCGVQARSHLEIFSKMFPLRQVRVYGRGQANMEQLCALAETKGLTAIKCQTPREAIENADLVVSSVTLSFELTPFVDARWLKLGAFAAITDAATPWMGETLAELHTVVIDDLAQEQVSEKKMLDPGLITGDLKGLVGADFAAGFDPHKTSTFIFRGIAIGDFAVAGLAYHQAKLMGLGEKVSWN